MLAKNSRKFGNFIGLFLRDRINRPIQLPQFSQLYQLLLWFQLRFLFKRKILGAKGLLTLLPVVLILREDVIIVLLLVILRKSVL